MSKKIVEVEFEKDEHAQKHLHYTRFGFELLKSESWTTRKESSDRIIREYTKNLYQLDKDRPHAKERLRLFRKYKWKCAERDAILNATVKPKEVAVSCSVGGVAGFLLMPAILGEDLFSMDVGFFLLEAWLMLMMAFLGAMVSFCFYMVWVTGITKKKRLVRALAGTKELDEEIEQITLEAQKLL